MRILYHHRTLADGAEGIHIAEMVAAFRELGHDVRVIGLGEGKPGDQPRGIATRLRRQLPEAAAELAGVAMDAVECRAVTRAIDGYRPDFMYKRHARNNIGALRAAQSRRVPSVLEVNCLYTSPAYLRFEPLTFQRLAVSMERRALALATRVLAVSSPLGEEVRRMGMRHVSVLPNAANPATFRPTGDDPRVVRAQLGLAEALTIGWAGIVREWHGLDLMLDVLQQVPQVQFLIVGDGPGREALDAAVARRGLAGRVRITGRIPHGRIAHHLGAVDIAVVVDERTGIASPMKLLEYMAMGLTVVAPDAPNIRDLVTPDVDGRLFRAGDPDDLSRTIALLAAEPTVRRRLGENARMKIERERTWRHNAQAVLRLVETAIPAGGHRPDPLERTAADVS